MIIRREFSSEEQGQFAVREAIDICSAKYEMTVRIDFFGDRVEEIRSFDPTSQRSSDRHSRIRVSNCKANSSDMRECAFSGICNNPQLGFS